MSYQFKSITRSLRDETPEPEPTPSNPVAAAGQKVLGNLLGHIPTEAVALSTSLTPLIDGKENSMRAWAVFVGSLILTCLVRWLNKASVSVWITSLLAFFLWMAMVPGGALQQAFTPDPVLVVIIAGVFSAVVTALASAGKLN